MGVVSPIGEQGSVIAKVAALKAGWDWRCSGVQLNRFCASGLEAVNMAAQKVRSGWEDLVVAGGVESMSRVPIGSDGGAWSQDPETNAATAFVPQGIGADLIATLEGFSREDVDAFALESQKRAAKAREGGRFAGSVVPVALSGADPTIMLTGPMPAARKALAKAGMTIDQIDLFEINEAFAAVPMKFMKEMGVPHEKVNVNGGAIAMGHPLGATGAMILNTLIDELHRRKLRYGMATL